MSFEIGILTYAAAAVAFLFLSVLLITSWRGRLQGAVLLGATLTSTAWAAVMAWQASRPERALAAASVLEVLHDLGWLSFLLLLLGYAWPQAHGSSRGPRAIAVAILGFGAALLAATVWTGSGDAHHFAIPNFLTGIIGPGLLSVAGIVLIEQLYRNTHPQQRWGIKFLCVGLGGMFAFDFYLFSDAMLFRRISPDIWEARGVVNAMVVPLIAISAARNPKWSLDVFVSRQALFHSTALLGAGMYLLVMAVAGYYIRFVGGTWGGVLQTFFLFAALLLLLVILFSGTLRARLKVFLSKHFFSYRYDYREEWLRFTRTLSEGEPGVRLHERSIQAIAELVESPGGALWMRRERDGYERVAHWNLPGAGGAEPAGGPLARFLEERPWVVGLDDYDSNPELYAPLELPEWLRQVPRAWLVVPLTLHESLLGFIVLARSRGQVRVNWEVNDLLKTAGRQAASYLAQLEAAKALLEARQFESFNRMSAFVVHDLKNLVAQLSLLLKNAERHRHNPEFQQDMLETVQHSVNKMNRLLLQLRHGGPPVEPPSPVALEETVRSAVAAKAGLRPLPSIDIRDGDLWALGDRERLERVVGHLVQNACEATPDGGSVGVLLERRGGRAVIEVTDTGRGMSEQFMRDRLFKPFDSTKDSGMGIGTYESRTYVHDLGGSIEVESREGEGTRFRVLLPLYVPRQTAAETA